MNQTVQREHEAVHARHTGRNSRGFGQFTGAPRR
jgi:hypothetical protein